MMLSSRDGMIVCIPWAVSGRITDEPLFYAFDGGSADQPFGDLIGL
jgi:hypothetical protein